MADLSPDEVLARVSSSSKITGSWLAVLATGAQVKPGHIKTPPGASCSACGHAFLLGELGNENPTHKSVRFNDAYSLVGPASAPVCSACATVLGAAFLPVYPSGVACLDGFFPFASNAHRAWFLLNPPEPPFVMATGLAKQQHLFWRTPVATNSQVFPVRVGTHVGMVRRQVLRRVAEIGGNVLQAAEEHETRSTAATSSKRGRPKKEGTGVVRHPYARLDRDMESWRHGEVKATVMRFLASGEAPREAHLLCELNEIELWALSNIANTKPKDVLTERPPLFQPSLKNKEAQLEAMS